MIRSPQELRTQALPDLERLAEDIRQRIVSVCLKNGGHLGASLGTVELAIALHTVFDSPNEALIWDVGHQAYAHKLLTGRWDSFEKLRKEGGISGFPTRDESDHDAFGTGHSSTALSAALGIAWDARGTSRWSVAVVGDGSLTAGLSFEALNNVTATETGPLLLVLNDNSMSISRNVGAIPEIMAGERAREFFELFGFDYVGPVNGHDLGSLIGTLQGLRANYRGKPVVLHALTQKGRGYGPAEEAPVFFHGISPVQEKIPDRQASSTGTTFSEAFGEAVCKLAEKDPRVVVLTAAMPEGTGLSEYSRRYPDRFFDVGIAEQHAVTFAAGLATRGMRPIVAIYSTFLQRAFDQLIHDVALQKLGVTFAIDRAGLVGADGPTHHGAFDLAYLSIVPNLQVFAPVCAADLNPLLEQAINKGTPCAIRYPRGSAAASCDTDLNEFLRWHMKPKRPGLFAIAVGASMSRVLSAARKADPNAERIAVISSVAVKPLPPELIRLLQHNSSVPLLTVEDGVIRGGFGEALLSSLGPRSGSYWLAGFGDRFLSHGSPAGLEKQEGLSVEALAERMQSLQGGNG